MRYRLKTALALTATLASAAAASAQTHIVKKPETVVRAVAVYEYTGDETKVTASRLIPVSIYINAELADAGVYKAAPVPFTLGTGTVFELEKSGVPEGTLEISYQRHLQSSGDLEFDDGWAGYGAFKPRPRPNLVAGVQKGPLPQVLINGKPADDASASSTATTKRPPVDRSTAATGKVAISGEDDDDAEPVLVHKTVDAPASSTGSGSQDTSVDSSDKSDRPTLKKREQTDASSTPQKKPRRQGDVASVRSAGSLNDDPDRPTIHRGPPPGQLDENSLPPLNGLPADMKQLVAVSDARDRPEHVFTRPWDSDAERAEVLATMENAARARLARYDSLTGLSTNAAPAPAATKPAAPKPTTAAARRKAAAAAKPAAAPLTLTDEQLHGYTLSYGGAPTFVYTASAPGAKGVTQYVTVIAQREGSDNLKLALTSVTDSSHLDRTPWMRPIDAVDAEASNRASLLFELRAQHTRQFALYRVIGGQADQTLATGSNP